MASLRDKDQPTTSRLERVAGTSWAPVLFVAVISLLLTLRCAWRPLWYDELFTYYVAAQPDAASVLAALDQGADIHPPVDYLLRHGSMRLFGHDALGLRLPSLIAFATTLLVLFALLRRRTNVWSCWLALLLPVCTVATEFAFEARPYALLLASAAVAMLAWARAVERQSVGRLGFLAIALGVGPLVHYHGVIAFAAVAVGEIVRTIHTRRVDVRVLASGGAGLAIALLAVPYGMRATAFMGDFWTPVHHSQISSIYMELFIRLAAPSTLALVVLAGVLALDRRVAFGEDDRRPALPLTAIAATFAASPLLVYLIALGAGAMTARYAIGAIAGVAVLAGTTAGALLGKHRTALVAIVAVFAVVGSYHVLRLAKAGLRDRDAEPARPLAEFLATTDDPVVIDDALQFLEMTHHLPPDLRGRVTYLLDKDAALQFVGYDTDLALTRLHRIVPMKLVESEAFLEAHGAFTLLHGRGALLPSLLDRGLAPRRTGTVGELEAYRVESSRPR